MNNIYIFMYYYLYIIYAEVIY